MYPRAFPSPPTPPAAHLSEVLEMTPLTKVLFGTDGFSLPEINYAGVMLGKTALTGALEEMVEGSLLSQAEAEEAAALILAENARRLYGLNV